MKLDFGPIDLKKQSEYQKLYHACTQKASDYSFTNLWGWSEQYKLEWAWHRGLVWIRQNSPFQAYWAPVGKWDDTDWNLCMKEVGSMTDEFIRVPESLINYWQTEFRTRMQIEETKGAWDYIYAFSDLANLKGNRFHKKKNLVNQFNKKYNSRYIPFGLEMVEKAKDMQDDWCTWRDCEAHDTLAAENQAIARVLGHWDQLRGLMGGAIVVDGVMVCYTIAEAISEDTIVIHFEKGNPDYKGSYQAINKNFLLQQGNRFSWVNREQDLGDDGLRKAKMSYHPELFLVKNTVRLKL